MKNILLVFICSIILAEAFTQTPVLVKNINPQDQGNGISNELAYLGTDYVFVSGKQLWRTDGTTPGTVLIKDFTPENISSLSRLSSLGTSVIFYAGGTTNQVWKTDGTGAGTLMLKDFGSINTVLFYRAAVAGTLFFSAGDNATGNELWKTDGTVAGTVIVKDIATGTASASPYRLQNLGGTLFFFATTTTTGTSLYKSDGSDAGTVLVKDLDPSSTAFANAGDMTVAGVKVFFNFTQSATGQEAWVSDGTDAGTFLLKDITPGTTGSFADKFTAVGNTVYFQAQDAINRQLWKTDGTTVGTVPFYDLVPSSKNDSYTYLTNCNGLLYFAATTSVVLSTEPYVSNGSATMLLKDIVAGTNGSDARGFQYFNGFTYFIANTPATGYELWKTDGTEANTAILTEIVPGSGAGIGGTVTINGIVNNRLLFSGVDTLYNAEPFVSDGTAAGTTLLKNIQTQGLGGFPTYLTPVGNRIYFSGTIGFSNIEPWYSDGTEAGTKILKDIEAGFSRPFDFTNIDNVNFYFKTYSNLRNIYKSDGTATGTTQIVPDVIGDPMVIVNDILFFIKRDNTNGNELWKYQAGAASLVKNINPGSLNSFPSALTAYNNLLYFFANDGVSGDELWKSDGTAAGTLLAADINAGPASSNLFSDIKVFNGSLYFIANNGTGNTLMKSNGSSAGTIAIKSFAGNGATDNFFVFNNSLFFIRKNVNASSLINVECWKTDGTPDGTVLVKQILPYTSGASLNYLNVISFFTNGNQFYFYMDKENLFGETLQIGFWRSDGTTPGTYELVSYLFPNDKEGNFENNLNFVARYDNQNVLFTFSDAIHGQEIWKTDGTVGGTAIAAELVPGAAGSNPAGLINFGDAIYFSAASTGDFNELWKINALSPVPLKLLSFDAVKLSKTVQLQWKTTNEINSSHFLVQLSIDGIKFDSLTLINAFNSNATHTYTAIDLNPNFGKNFYRLKIVDTDGRFTYSPVIKISFESKNNISIFPNPANNVFVIGGMNDLVNLQLFDRAGKKVKQFLPNAANRYSIAGLPKGMYLLQLTKSDNSIQTQKLMIE